MKTIALFGGTTGTGMQFMHMALEQGYKIKTLLPEYGKIRFKNPNLIIYKGDAANIEDVKKTVKGCNVVVCLLSHLSGSSEWLQTESTQNIVSAMKRYNVSKIITTSGGGLLHPIMDKPGMGHHAMRIFMQIAAPKIYYDAVKQVDTLSKSGLKYIIVRRPVITDEAQKGHYSAGWIGHHSGMKISRADLAQFVLEQIDNEEFNFKMPFVSY